MAIVESFGLSEDTLGSAIATEDGKIYEKLLDWAQNHNDMNRADIKEDLRKHTVKAMNEMRKVTTMAAPKL